MTPAPSIVPLSGSNNPVADLLRRRRTGRLPLATLVAEVATEEHPALELVDHFMDQLAELPLDGWLSIGRDLAANDTLHVRQVAWGEADAAIADQKLEMAAWYARDAIETAVCLASRQTSRWSRDERCLFAAAHGAAEAAALALLARRHISAQSCRSLCAPFASQLEGQQL